jgi:sortase (surface protein transpeptidase)
MKFALLLLISVPVLLTSFGATAQSKSQKEANDHYKSQQRSNESNRQTNNAIVNNNSQRKR